MAVTLSGLLLTSSELIAQINIDTTQTADYLVKHILMGNGVLAGNVKFTGKKYSTGLYQDESGQLGLNVGIVLTSGNAIHVPGPNKTSRSGWASDAAGDFELDKITRGKTYDASILEFDFVTQSEHLSFEYIFASEEYPEYVDSKFNDVFAFFVNGPGLDNVNIARLPDDKTPITVNTVNYKLNKNFFVDNTFTNTSDPFLWDVRKRKVVENKNYLQKEVQPNYHVQFDGFTTVLTAECTVKPNHIYHIKIAIADVGDGILDSGVILKGGSFRSHGNKTVHLDDHFKDSPVPKSAESRKPLLAENYLTRSIPARIRVGNVHFDFDKYLLPQDAETTLTTVVKEWNKNSGIKVYVTGHTDSWGSEAYNFTLSENRAAAVASALKALGIPEEKVIIDCYGEGRPAQDNHTSGGRALNRRVELILEY